MAENPEPTWWPDGPIPRPTSSPVGAETSPPGPSKSGGGIAALVAVATIAGVLGGLVMLAGLSATGALVAEGEPSPTTTAGTTTVVINRPPVTDQAATTDIAGVAKAVLPSVVRVVVYSAVENPASEDFLDRYDPVGTGSGVGFTAEGHVLTNNHVVEGADLIRVELVDGRIYPAELVGRDHLTDVAVIKVAPGLVQPIPLANRSDLAIGDLAIAVGNPLGLAGGPSVSVGIISAFERPLDINRPDGSTQNLQGLIQTDAAISGGSSGGALVDASGALIGITTAKSVGEATEGVGFAVPVDLVENIALDLIASGSITHPFLGILGTTHYRELSDGAQMPAGAEVVRIIGGEPGDPVDSSAFGEAGAEAGDVIVSFDGITITNMNQLASLLRRYRAGQEVPITVERDTVPLELLVSLDARPGGT